MKFASISKVSVFVLGLVLTYTAVSNAAIAPCTQLTNQFTGKVRNVQHKSNGLGETVCTYQVDVIGTPDGVCPLADERASTLTLIDSTCKLANGDYIDGYITTKTWIQ